MDGLRHALNVVDLAGKSGATFCRTRANHDDGLDPWGFIAPAVA
jgi:hypothetical protein